MVRSLVLCGVGGQGIIRAGSIISAAALKSGLDVKSAEVHGMAQRGGSVVTQIRFGDKVLSPLIKRKGADFMLGLEKLEALRYIDYLKPDGIALVADLELIPVTVSIGLAEYPENLDLLLKERAPNLRLIDPMPIAREVGEPRAANVVMIGALSNLLPFEEAVWEEAIAENVPPKTVEANLKAFRMGRELLRR